MFLADMTEDEYREYEYQDTHGWRAFLSKLTRSADHG